MFLKQSTNRNRVVLMIDDSDHITGKTGLTLTITASKDGAAFASISPTVTELSNGWYNLALTTTHTNTLGAFALHITGSGADPTDIVDEVIADLPTSAAVIADAVWDELRAGHVTAGSFGEGVASVQGNVTGSVASVTARVTVNSGIIKNSGFASYMFLITDAATHEPITALSDADFVLKTYSLDGSTPSALSGTIDEVGDGWYKITFTAGELNANNVALQFQTADSDLTAISFVTTT